MEFILWLIFIKVVLQVVKRFKKIAIIEKDCDNEKKIVIIKKIVIEKIAIIQRDCDNEKRF